MTFTDLDDCFHSAVEILHKDRQATYPTSRVYRLIEAIPSNYSSNKELLKKLYRDLAMEAFYYAAESGSEYTIMWFLNCTCKMFYYIKDKNFHWMMLLHSGFIFYNLALDLKRRYAVEDKIKVYLIDAVKEYKRQADYFEKIYADSLSNEGKILRILRLIIATALYSNMWDSVPAEQNVRLVSDAIKMFSGIVPNILQALYEYETGRLARLGISLSNERPNSKENFFKSFDLLKKHFEEESIEAIYCYNALHGNY